ncbi:MAG TPA: hypothetical protein VMM18_01785 [Gemmatimonadaceae bacterium]|nr:hypothetical protein [Gemmatimonadaceae bacterium]
MTPASGTPLLVGLAILFGVLGAIFLVAGTVALRRARPLGFGVQTLTGLLFLSLGALAGAIGLGMRGYRALTHEELAARIDVRPVGPQRFTATVHVPDRPAAIYELTGDEIYIDAHILKWKPLANVLGLHTAYELHRISGRYDDIDQERTSDRTVHSLVTEKPVDLFRLRRRYAFLAPMLDAEYGSGTFVPVRGPSELEVLVSTTGLLIREARSGAK